MLPLSRSSKPSSPDDMLAHLLAPLLSARGVLALDVPIARIGPNPFQARTQFDDLAPLADAMRQHGFTSRLRVRPDPTRDGDITSLCMASGGFGQQHWPGWRSCRAMCPSTLIAI